MLSKREGDDQDNLQKEIGIAKNDVALMHQRQEEVRKAWESEIRQLS